MASTAEGPLRVWRLCKREHAAFDGEGARLAGGRWNRRGTPMIYTSQSLSLAAIEILVHCDPGLLPDLVAIPADIPEAVSIEPVDEATLPRGWRRHPPPDALAKIGSAWANSARTPVLSVPSAVVSRERNYLLNPRHPDFTKIRRGEAEPFSFDRRLNRRLRSVRDLPRHRRAARPEGLDRWAWTLRSGSRNASRFARLLRETWSRCAAAALGGGAPPLTIAGSPLARGAVSSSRREDRRRERRAGGKRQREGDVGEPSDRDRREGGGDVGRRLDG